MKKHIGKIVNTDQRVVIVMMQIPDRNDHALVISIDNLPPRYEQTLMDIVESNEGQAETVLANVLNRRIMSDTSMTVLNTLHQQGYLRAVHIDQIVMLPLPNMPFPLRDIIAGMNNGNAPPPSQEAPATADKFNAPANNVAANTKEQRLGIAKNLLVEADLLQVEADRKRNEAFKYAPELKPAVEVTMQPAKASLEKVVAPKRRAKSTKSQ